MLALCSSLEDCSFSSWVSHGEAASIPGDPLMSSPLSLLDSVPWWPLYSTVRFHVCALVSALHTDMVYRMLFRRLQASGAYVHLS